MKAPDIKGHLIVSVAKSSIRIGACIVALFTKSVLHLAIGFLIAEALGLVEELV